MLQKLNERIQGVVAWVVIILIAVTFTLFGIDYYMQAHHDSSTQVEVNGQPITKESFELSYRRTRQMRDPSQMTAASENQLRKQVLDELIMNDVSVQAARSNGFEVNIAQANAAILSIPQFQEDGHFSTDRYQQALSGAFFTPESFQKEVRQGMLLNQQRFAFIGTAFALPSEVKRFVKLYMQTRDYSYLSVSSLPFIKQVSVSDEEVSNYYNEHQKEFLTPEKVTVDYLRLSMQAIKANIKLNETQVQQYYDENKSNYLTPAQWQVAHILFTVPEGASTEEQENVKAQAEKVYQLLQSNPALFEEQVKLSDDKISAKNKGILPWITAGQSEFDKALIHLTNPGQITAPVKSAHGYELFKLMAYKPATLKPFSDVKAEIETQMLTELAQTVYAKNLEQLSELSYQTPDSLTPVADALKLKVEQSPPFSRQGGDSPLTQNKQIINAAFSHDVLELGNNSEPIQVDNDSVIVLRLNQRMPAVEKKLPEVKSLIANKLAGKKAAEQAKQLGNQLLTAIQNGVEQAQLIAANHLQWHDIMQATRETDKAPEPINELAFNLPRTGASMGKILASGDYVIVQLKAIHDGKIKSLDKEQIASITQQIEANYGVMDYDLYVNSLLTKAEIVRH